MATAKRLLIVDDEVSFATFVSRVAQGLGYETRASTDAASFREEYDRFDPTVIVLDIVMPDTDGLEVMRWLAGRGCRAKVIAVTGYNPEYSEFAAKLGAIGGLAEVSSLRKPISVENLREALR